MAAFAEYGEQIKGEVADIKNVGAGRWGGAITAGKRPKVRDVLWTDQRSDLFRILK